MRGGGRPFQAQGTARAKALSQSKPRGVGNSETEAWLGGQAVRSAGLLSELCEGNGPPAGL